MPYENTSHFYRLKCARVRDLIQHQDLKRWWVAEEAGIHKTTLRRWLSGRIDKVRGEHVSALARVLSTTNVEIADPVPAVSAFGDRPQRHQFLD